MSPQDKLSALSDQELIERVAFEVMGWDQGSNAWISREPEASAPGGYPNHEVFHQVKDWDPLRNWNHTMELVDRLASLGFCCSIQVSNPKPDRFMCWNAEAKMADCRDENLRKAICLTALQAVSPSK